MRNILVRRAIGAIWRLEHAFEHSRAASKPQDDARVRISAVLVLFALAFAVLAIGAGRSALDPNLGRHLMAADGGGARADLVDRRGSLLAVNLPYYALFVSPADVWSPDETIAALARALPWVPRARIEKAVRGERRSFVVGGLTPAMRDQVFDLGLPGVILENQDRRRYPLGHTAAHLIGFVDDGGKGLAGAERALEADSRPGENRSSISLSIDLRVQAALEAELAKGAAQFKPLGAVGLVTNVHTGEIVALASLPDFDPNQPGEASDAERLNRAASQVFEMGSTFKAFTVAIGLDTGVATPSTRFDTRAPFHLGYRTIRDLHASDHPLSLVEVFQHSSNIGSAMLAEQVGADRTGRYFDALGLTRSAQVELRESARPLTPKVWNEDAVASTAFGHGIMVSPLTLAQAMGSLVNGGLNVPLTIRKASADNPPEGRRVVSERTSRDMLAIMRANVSGKVASGRSADIPGYSVGGKTGTGEKYDPALKGYSHKRQVSSFAAVFPTSGSLDAKRYFVLILYDEPHGTAETFGFSTANFVAAPVAGRVIARIAPFLGVARSDDDTAGIYP